RHIDRQRFRSDGRSPGSSLCLDVRGTNAACNERRKRLASGGLSSMARRSGIQVDRVRADTDSGNGGPRKVKKISALSISVLTIRLTTVGTVTEAVNKLEWSQ